MTPELKKKLLVAKVLSMLAEADSRTGLTPYAELAADIESLELDVLETIRRDLHELLYAPPVRQGR